jgi:hypothetical protein
MGFVVGAGMTGGVARIVPGVRRPATWVLAALCALVVLCEPAGAASADRPAAVSTKLRGALVVSVAGVPRGSLPVGVVRGPGFARRIGARRTVLRVRPGAYTVRLRRTTVARTRDEVKRRAKLIPSARRGLVRVRVRAGARVRAAVRYGSVVNPGVRAVPAQRLLAVEGSADDPTAVTLAGSGSYAPGTILSLRPVQDRLPRGLLARVVAVERGAGRMRVRVRTVSPFDVVPVGEFSIGMGEQSERALATAVRCGGASGIDPYREIRDVRFNGSWNTTRLFGNEIKTGVRASIHLTVEAGVRGTGGVGIDCSASKAFWINGMAGPVPVTAAVDGELSAYAGVGARFTTGGSVRVGLGVSTVGATAHPTVSVERPRFSFAASAFADARASIGLGTTLGIGNSNAGSVTARFGSNLDFTARPGSCSWDASVGRFSARGSIWRWAVSSPQTPALVTRNLWRGCGG